MHKNLKNNSYLILFLLSQILVVFFLGCERAIDNHLDKNKEIVLQAWEEVINKGNLEAADEFFHADYTEHYPGGTATARGTERVKQAVAWMLKVFPDLNFKIEDIFAEGDKVVSRVIGTGTQSEEFMGIAPTGKKVRIYAVVISRIADGKIIEDWSMQDNLGVLKQIGEVTVQEKEH